jgi:glycosyl transferase family 8
VTGPELTFLTIADERYFLGAAALVNSVRLTGHGGTIVVLDSGMTSHQRMWLEHECDVRRAPEGSGPVPLYLKAETVLTLEGTVVYLDSDVIVTSDLGQFVEPAGNGRLCVFRDGLPDRRFEQWPTLLHLRGDLRGQEYVNAGIFAVDVEAWRPTLERWSELCDEARSVRTQIVWGSEGFDRSRDDPLFFHDQDVLNALLMSEVPPDRLAVREPWRLGIPQWPVYEAGGRIVDRRALTVHDDEGRPMSLLHYWDQPKPWMPGARRGVMFEAYVELTSRLLTAGDAPVRVPRSWVPRWLRDDVVGRTMRRGPRRAKRAVRRVVHAGTGRSDRGERAG